MASPVSWDDWTGWQLAGAFSLFPGGLSVLLDLLSEWLRGPRENIPRDLAYLSHACSCPIGQSKSITEPRVLVGGSYTKRV